MMYSLSSLSVLLIVLLILQCIVANAAPGGITFTQSAPRIDAYDFVEITLEIDKPDVKNPFTDVSLEGEFQLKGNVAKRVEGFCDSADGSVFRIRFMPQKSGLYEYKVTYQQGDFIKTHYGRFTANIGNNKGLVRVDARHPWHFIYEGTKEHYFYNGTTTYFLAGWDEENIYKNLDRLAGLKVNRVRAAISGRVDNGQAWYENVYPTDKFSFLLNPWVAEKPDSVANPGFDVTRFNVDYWRKWENLLKHARERGIIVSVIFYVDGARPGVDPFGKQGMGGEDEQRYYRYAMARFAPYANVMWDLSNEYRFFRDDAWAEKMGAFVKANDPYDHLTSVHGHEDFAFMQSPWADFAMYQSWDNEAGYDYMLERRREQAATSRPIPQVNEEYGYEHLYASHEPGKIPSRTTESRRRIAWEISMAGGYQTAGERADTGTGWGADTGGGWVNGRGDDSMVLFKGYGHMVDFFTSFNWWEMKPDNDFYQEPHTKIVRQDLMHITYTRTADGQAKFYMDGVLVSQSTVPGDVSNWDENFQLALANELTRDRTWLGEYHRIAIYDRSLDASEVEACYEAGFNGMANQPLALYKFNESAGEIVRDMSGNGEALDLKIADMKAVEWLKGGGLAVRQPTIISSGKPAAKINNAIRQSNAISVEAWVKPANITQKGPARILTFSKDTGERNFTLGQDKEAIVMRLRTTQTSTNGEPALWAPAEGSKRLAIGLRSPVKDLAVIYLPMGGEVTVKSDALVKGLSARWFNPRTGEWAIAKLNGNKKYVAPDTNDWALLFDK